MTLESCLKLKCILQMGSGRILINECPVLFHLSPIFSQINREFYIAYTWDLLIRIFVIAPFFTSTFSLTWLKSTIRKVWVAGIDISLEQHFLWIINGPERCHLFFWFPLPRTVQHLIRICMREWQFRFHGLSKLWIKKQGADFFPKLQLFISIKPWRRFFRVFNLAYVMLTNEKILEGGTMIKDPQWEHANYFSPPPSY